MNKVFFEKKAVTVKEEQLRKGIIILVRTPKLLGDSFGSF